MCVTAFVARRRKSCYQLRREIYKDISSSLDPSTSIDDVTRKASDSSHSSEHRRESSFGRGIYRKEKNWWFLSRKGSARGEILDSARINRRRAAFDFDSQNCFSHDDALLRIEIEVYLELFSNLLRHFDSARLETSKSFPVIEDLCDDDLDKENWNSIPVIFRKWIRCVRQVLWKPKTVFTQKSY